MTILTKIRPLTRLGKTVDLIQFFAPSSQFFVNRTLASEKKESGLTKGKERSEVSTDVRPIGEKIKDATKTVSYTGVILIGIGVTGVIFYYVFRELFSSNSANSIYSVALEKCKNVSKTITIPRNLVCKQIFFT